MKQINDSLTADTSPEEAAGAWIVTKPDTLQSLSDTSGQKEVISLFSGAQSYSKLSEKEFQKADTDWITLHLIVVLIILSYTRVFFLKRLKQISKAFYNNRNLSILLREGNIFTERISIAAIVVYLISFSLFVYQFLFFTTTPGQLPLNGYKLFAVIILIVLVAVVIKNMAVTAVGKIFRNQLLLSEFILMNFVFTVNLGIWLLPLMILSVFLPSIKIVYLGAGLWFIVFIYKVFRQFFTGLGYPNFSHLNRFLYLCTLEIIPFLVLIKLILSNLNL